MATATATFQWEFNGNNSARFIRGETNKNNELERSHKEWNIKKDRGEIMKNEMGQWCEENTRMKNFTTD